MVITMVIEKKKKKKKKCVMAEKRFKCDICKKEFKWASGLSVHKRLHSGVKPFKCKICGKSFTRQHHLADHGKVHSGKTPYNCKICGKSFTNSSTLFYHKIIHTGERPFKCGLCDKAFNHPTHLTHHKRSHTKERPYKCEICGKTFGHPSHLAQHRKIHSDIKKRCKGSSKAPSRSRKSLLRKKCSTTDWKKKEHLNISSVSKKRPNNVEIALLELEVQICRANWKFGPGKTEGVNKTGQKPVDNNSPSPCHDSPVDEHVQQKESNVLSMQNTSFSCTKCSASLSSKEGLEQHKCSQSTDRDFKCFQCEMNFNCPRKYDQHLLYHDLNATEPTGCPYICFKCDESFDLISGLVDHINIRHKHEVGEHHHVDDLTEVLEPAHNCAKIHGTNKLDNDNHQILSIQMESSTG